MELFKGSSLDPGRFMFPWWVQAILAAGMLALCIFSINQTPSLKEAPLMLVPIVFSAALATLFTVGAIRKRRNG